MEPSTTASPSALDTATFQRAFLEHGTTVHRYATSRVGPDLADDVVADTFAQAWRLRRQYEIRDGTKVDAWLLGIATHVIARHRRAERRWLRMCADSATEAAANMAVEHEDAVLLERIDAARTAARIAAALRKLPARERDPLLLHTVEGLSYDEIARTLDVPIGTVRSRISRGRGRIARITGIVLVLVFALLTLGSVVQAAANRTVRSAFAVGSPAAAMATFREPRPDHERGMAVFDEAADDGSAGALFSRRAWIGWTMLLESDDDQLLGRESVRVMLDRTAYGVRFTTVGVPTARGKVCTIEVHDHLHREVGDSAVSTCVERFTHVRPVLAGWGRFGSGSHRGYTYVHGLASDDVVRVHVDAGRGRLEPATMGRNAFGWSGGPAGPRPRELFVLLRGGEVLRMPPTAGAIPKPAHRWADRPR